MTKIVVLGTGGTIAGTAMKATDNVGYKAATIGVDQLLATIPSLGASLAGRILITEQVAQIDSKDMSLDILRTLAQRTAHWLNDSEVEAVVVTHGTDTLEETAFFLESVLPAALTADKPVVLTCAMRPATAVLSDGPQNLLDAFAVATAPGASGVMVVCAGCIHGALEVQKVHTYRLDAFSSGDAGPLGHVEEGHVRWTQACAPTAVVRLSTMDLPAAAAAPDLLTTLSGVRAWPSVEILMNYAGAGAQTVAALVAQGVQGIVVAGTGNGSLNQTLEAALLEAQAVGVKVIRASRCASGRVLAKPGDRIPASSGLSPVKARLALILALMGHGTPDKGA
jgi:L-asparaginase